MDEELRRRHALRVAELSDDAISRIRSAAGLPDNDSVRSLLLNLKDSEFTAVSNYFQSGLPNEVKRGLRSLAWWHRYKEDLRDFFLARENEPYYKIPPGHSHIEDQQVVRWDRRINKALWASGINTIEQLELMTDEEILGVHRMNAERLLTVRDEIMRYRERQSNGEAYTPSLVPRGFDEWERKRNEARNEAIREGSEEGDLNSLMEQLLG